MQGREYKFRAWLWKHLKVVDVIRIDFETQEITYQEIDFEYDDVIREKTTLFKDISLLQYTGLENRNGVEIYEGDIVNVDNTYICYIEYDINNGCHLIVNNKGRWTNILTKERAKRCEVIGNIYENKELLNENN